MHNICLMDHSLVAVFTLLLFVTLSSTDQVILEKKPASGGTWIWDRSRIQTAAGGPAGEITYTKLTTGTAAKFFLLY